MQTQCLWKWWNNLNLSRAKCSVDICCGSFQYTALPTPSSSDLWTSPRFPPKWKMLVGLNMMQQYLNDDAEFRKIIWSLFHRVLPACPKMSYIGLVCMVGIPANLHTEVVHYRTFWGPSPALCTVELWSGKVQSFLASSSLGSPWCGFGKIVQS